MKYLHALGYFIVTLIMYLLVPLIGWGLGDMAGFFSLGPRCVYAVVAALLGASVAWQSIEDPHGFRGGAGEKGKLMPRQRIVRNAVIGFMYTALVFLPFADRRGIGVLVYGLPLRWVGMGMAAAGFLFIFWSGVSLGKYYSADVTLQKDHHLIKDGPYRFIRHPRYLGALLLGIGMTLLFRSWIGFILIVPFTGVVLFRIRDEEAFMRMEFGVDWDVYCGESWRLIPYVY
jgi:protein-S-isoprenylcysteine O-methyltransferase Ste14